MTVHGAKGLEFPIVILPNLQKKFQFDNRESLDKELGLQIKLPESEDPAAIAEVIRLRARASTIAEEKRVFYVAATRARDHLVLSCTLPKKPPKDTWLSWAGEALPGAFDPLRESISVEERISRYRSDERTVVEEFLQFDIPLLRTEKDIPNVDQQVLAVSPLQGDVLFYLDPLVANRATGRFSATQFLRFKECPLKYHLSYVLGMPAEPKLSYDLEASELSEVVRGDLLGQMVHKLLDRIDAISSNGTLDKDRFDSSIDRILFDLRILNKDDKASYAATAKEHVQRALDSDPAGEFLTRAGAQTEFSLQARFETGDILYGIVDRLYQDSSGVWTVLDYKTERTNDPLRKSQNKLRYEFQLQFYAYLVHLLYPEQPAVRVILLYTASGESVEFNHDRTSFEGLRTEIANLIDAIRQNEQAVDLETIDRNLHHCPDCQFFDEHEGRCIALSAEALEADGYSSEVSEFA
jgi:ATP-dependent helicase/nuclease subunit A